MNFKLNYLNLTGMLYFIISTNLKLFLVPFHLVDSCVKTIYYGNVGSPKVNSPSSNFDSTNKLS